MKSVKPNCIGARETVPKPNQNRLGNEAFVIGNENFSLYFPLHGVNWKSIAVTWRAKITD